MHGEIIADDGCVFLKFFVKKLSSLDGQVYDVGQLVVSGDDSSGGNGAIA